MKKLLFLLIICLSTVSCIEDDSCRRKAIVTEYVPTVTSTSKTMPTLANRGGDVTILSGTGTEADPYIIDLSGMTDNIKIDAGGPHQVNEWYETVGDVNLNGWKLDIHHISLVVNGNINGDGKLKIKNHTELCVTGTIQNNVEEEVHNEVFLFTQGQSCSDSTLSTGGIVYSTYEKDVDCDECGETFITDQGTIVYINCIE